MNFKMGLHSILTMVVLVVMMAGQVSAMNGLPPKGGPPPPQGGPKPPPPPPGGLPKTSTNSGMKTTKSPFEKIKEISGEGARKSEIDQLSLMRLRTVLTEIQKLPSTDSTGMKGLEGYVSTKINDLETKEAADAAAKEAAAEALKEAEATGKFDTTLKAIIGITDDAEQRKQLGEVDDSPTKINNLSKLWRAAKDDSSPQYADIIPKIEDIIIARSASNTTDLMVADLDLLQAIQLKATGDAKRRIDQAVPNKTLEVNEANANKALIEDLMKKTADEQRRLLEGKPDDQLAKIQNLLRDNPVAKVLFDLAAKMMQERGTIAIAKEWVNGQKGKNDKQFQAFIKTKVGTDPAIAMQKLQAYAALKNDEYLKNNEDVKKLSEYADQELTRRSSEKAANLDKKIESLLKLDKNLWESRLQNIAALGGYPDTTLAELSIYLQSSTDANKAELLVAINNEQIRRANPSGSASSAQPKASTSSASTGTSTNAGGANFDPVFTDNVGNKADAVMPLNAFLKGLHEKATSAKISPKGRSSTGRTEAYIKKYKNTSYRSQVLQLALNVLNDDSLVAKNTQLKGTINNIRGLDNTTKQAIIVQLQAALSAAGGSTSSGMPSTTSTSTPKTSSSSSTPLSPLQQKLQDLRNQLVALQSGLAKLARDLTTLKGKL